MGAEQSTEGGDDAEDSPLELEKKLADCCIGLGNFELYEAVWGKIDEFRQNPNDDPKYKTFDADLGKDAAVLSKILQWVKYALRHKETRWRKIGIEKAKSFFKHLEARKILVRVDMIGSLMLMTMPEDKAEEEDQPEGADTFTENAEGHVSPDQENLQLLVAETLCEMADYPEFNEALCSTAVLNFLCVVLNSLPSAVELVTHTFVKISRNQDNLQKFIEGAVGDILESFFKSVNCDRPAETDQASLKKWQQQILATSHCAHTMGTLVKFQFPCQADEQTIGRIFSSELKNVRLTAEVSRLFYWLCRSQPGGAVLRTVQRAMADGDKDGSQFAAPPGLGLVLDSLKLTWSVSIRHYKLIQQVYAYGEDFQTPLPSELQKAWEDFCKDDLTEEPFRKRVDSETTEEGKQAALKAAQAAVSAKVLDAEKCLCYMNCLFWVMLPELTLRWKLRERTLNELDLAFRINDSYLFEVILGTVRHLLDSPKTQKCHDLIEFFGVWLMAFLDEAIQAVKTAEGDQTDDQKKKLEKFKQAKCRKCHKRLTYREVIQGQKACAQYSKCKKRQCFFECQACSFYLCEEHGQEKLLRLLECIMILASQRRMQEVLALEQQSIWTLNGRVPDPNGYGKNDIWEKIKSLKTALDTKVNMGWLPKTETTCLRIIAQIATNPNHRLPWVPSRHETHGKAAYPASDLCYPSGAFGLRENQTMVSFLQEIRPDHQEPPSESTFKTNFKWWQVNSTLNYYSPEQKPMDSRRFDKKEVEARVINLNGLKRHLSERQKQKEEGEEELTTMVAMEKCAPYECTVALSLFSRMALEPSFKSFFFAEGRLEALLACVCSGVWAEAREAAATLANLMWLPDKNKESLVCWLKFDSANCIAVDAANVLLPVLVRGTDPQGRPAGPKPVALGKGMYKSTWGMEFTEGSCIILHPHGPQAVQKAIEGGAEHGDAGRKGETSWLATKEEEPVQGLKVSKVPTLLTSASPTDQLSTIRDDYEWLSKAPSTEDQEKGKGGDFTLTCWFYHDASAPSDPFKPKTRVLVENSQGYAHVSFKEDRWYVCNDKGEECPCNLKQLNNGWHHLALVSGQKLPGSSGGPGSIGGSGPSKGSRFYLNGQEAGSWQDCVSDEFFVVGNSQYEGGEKPFGLLCDFRIYAKCLDPEAIKDLAKGDLKAHPNQIALKLAELDAATILAQRLDVPDSAAECLRALGSLAAQVGSERAKIFHVCGKEIMELLSSPSPMIRTQAQRLLTNLT